MAAITTGDLRFRVLGPNGDPLPGMTSPDFQVSIADNTTTPRVTFNQFGTDADQNLSWDAVISGSAGHVLELQHYEVDATDAYDTSDFTVRIPVAAGYKAQGTIEQKTLRLNDRITVSTTGTRNDPRGLNDDATHTLDQWNSAIRFAPAPGESWSLQGFLEVVLHDDTA